MVFKMKKTISLLLAIVVAAVSICTLTICAFADETTTATQETTTEAAETTTELDLGDPRETEPSKEATTEEKKDDETPSATKGDETPSATKADSDVVTNPSGVTSIDDGDTTKAPAKVDDDIPDTGSGIVLPAIALLALAGGVTVAVKSKKD